MSNLPFLRKIEEAYNDLSWYVRDHSNFQEVWEDNPTWILKKFRYFDSLLNDREVQLQIMNYFKEESLRKCIKHFSNFPELQDEFELQKEILESAFEWSHLRGIVLDYIESFKIFEKDQDFLFKFLENSVSDHPIKVLNSLSELNIENKTQLHQLERAIIDTLDDEYDDLYVTELVENWENFETMDDETLAEEQYFILRKYIEDEGVQDGLLALHKFKALNKSQEWTLELARLCMRKRERLTMRYFDKFVAFRGNADAQLEFIKKIYDDHVHNINYAIAYFNEFDALQGEVEQKRVYDFLKNCSFALRVLSDYLNLFSIFDDNKDLQKELVENLLKHSDSYVVLYRFDNFESLKGDREFQERVFIECSKRESFGDLRLYLYKFDTLAEDKDFSNRLLISHIGSNGYLDRDDLKDESSYQEVMILGFEEALIRGHWESALSIIKESEIRDYMTENWRSIAKRLIDKRALENYDIASREGWIEDKSEDEHKKDECFWLQTLEKVMAVKNIQLSNILRRGFSNYQNEPDTLKFIFELIHNGQTMAENVLTVVRRISEYEDSIPLNVQRVILKIANSPFKGISRNTLNRILSLDSSRLQNEQLDQWAQQSRQILDGVPLSKEFRKGEFYLELVHAAYRPVGYGVDDIEDAIIDEHDEDDERKWMSHVEKWETKTWTLFDAKEFRLRRNKKIDQKLNEKIENWLKIFKQDDALNREKLLRIFFSTVKARSFDPRDGDIDFLIRLLFSKKDQALASFFSKLDADLTAQQIISDPTLLQSVLNNVFENMFGSVLKSVMVEEFINCSKSEDDNIKKWVLNILNRIQKNCLATYKKIAEQNPKMNKIEVSAHVVGHLISKSSKLEKEKRFVQKQLRLLEPVDSGYTHPLKAIVTKSLESILSRASAGLCTAGDYETFASSDFLQMNIIDEKACMIVGNIQLHLFDDEEKVLARLNPTSKFLSSGVDHKKLASEMIRICHEFADLNYLELYLPSQTDWHQLTNRDETVFEETLFKFYGDRESCKILINDDDHYVHTMFECKQSLES